MTIQGKRILPGITVAAALAITGPDAAFAQRAPGGPPAPSPFDAFYTLGPDSLPREGVPKGEIRGPFKLPSSVYPGVEHSYSVYVPAQYDGSREVSLMVFHDGATYLRAYCTSRGTRMWAPWCNSSSPRSMPNTQP